MKLANMLETAIYNGNVERSEIWDSDVLMEHVYYKGYVWPCRVQSHLGATWCSCGFPELPYDGFQNSDTSTIIILVQPIFYRCSLWQSTRCYLSKFRHFEFEKKNDKTI